MNYQRKIFFGFFYLAISVFSLNPTSIFAQQGESLLGKLTLQKGLTGAWKIDPVESEDVLRKIQILADRKENDRIEEGDRSRPSLSVSLLPPESLVLAAEDDHRMTINENYSDFVLTRTVATDGVQRYERIGPDVDISVTAAQRKDLLSVETVSPRGNKMIENYALSPTGDKLIVNLRFEDSAGRELLTLVRVYDRAALDVFPTGGGEIQ
ncbi:MAG: hypothetical protein R2747_13970 [Pyrinomonadaceae bacterium]